jgi:hypothetical protein
MKLFKDYLPYLIDDQSDQNKRYPTKALKWKSVNPNEIEWHHKFYVVDYRDRVYKRNGKLIFANSDAYKLIIEAEAYEKAKAQEDMWLPLGEGWKYLDEVRCFCNHDLDIDLYEWVDSMYIEYGTDNVVQIPIEICTLEIVQKIIHSIKELNDVKQS